MRLSLKIISGSQKNDPKNDTCTTYYSTTRMSMRNRSRRPRLNSPPHNHQASSSSRHNKNRNLSSKSICQRFTEFGSLLFFPSPPPFGKTAGGRRKTLVLDLDETLVHTSAHFESDPGILPPELRLDVETSNNNRGGKNHVFFVRLRPHLSTFLQECMELYEVVVFTASEKSYADPIVANIFSDAGCEIPRQCYYRPSCDPVMGMYIKDLTKVRNDLSKVILLDNSISASAYQPTNLMTISSWYGAKDDTELLDTLELLRILSTVSDVRNVLNLRLQNTAKVSMFSNHQ